VGLLHILPVWTEHYGLHSWSELSVQEDLQLGLSVHATTIELFVKPMLGTATSALTSLLAAVIDSHDQYKVWNNWNTSDPTHSFLSKVCRKLPA
jgi:hypothetical protein